MRIFVASGIFHPETGGPATYLYYILPELLSCGHHITVLSYGGARRGDYPYRVTAIPRQNFFLRHWNYYRTAAKLWPGHDVAYIHSLGLPLPRAARPRVAKIVGDIAWERAMNRGWLPRATDIDAFQSSRYSLRVELNKAMRALEARKLDHIIVPSKYLRRMVGGWGVDPRRISVIYNALETQGGQSVAQTQSQARAELGLPTRTPILLTAARLTPWKGIDHTIRALALLRNKRVHLIIAGDGPMRSALECLASEVGVVERVIFLGPVPAGKMPLYFRAADYTVLYSGYEGLSHVLLESLRAGTPVIASDRGGNPEVVTHGLNGVLVPYIDVKGLADALEHAVEPGQRKRLAEQTPMGLERFDWEQMVTSTEAVLRKVAGA